MKKLKFMGVCGLTALILTASMATTDCQAADNASASESIPFHYEIIQSIHEPYWIRIVSHDDHKSLKSLELKEEYTIRTKDGKEANAIITEIGDYAFYLSKIKELRLPSTVKSIGKFSLSSTSFEKIELNEGLAYIGARAFTSAGIEELEIPESVKYIDIYAFNFCTLLKKITLPSTLLEIGAQAFSYCGETTDIFCYAVLPPKASGASFGYPEEEKSKEYNAFDMSPGPYDTMLTIHVPEASLKYYREAPGWNIYSNFVPLEEK